MDGGSGFACAIALPAAPDAGGVAGLPAAGGAGEGVPAVAAPAGFAGSVITHTVMVTALAVSVWGLDEPAWGCVGISVLLRWLSALITARALDLPRGGLWLLPLRDALSFAVFLSSFFGRSVFWRDQLFRVEPSGQMTVEGDKPI